jgi:2-hydroxy-4-carboxymuconate semialdehyde hemiacetal dehydrogenase
LDRGVGTRTGARRIGHDARLDGAFESSSQQRWALGTFFRNICVNATYVARYDNLFTGRDEPADVSKVNVSMNGIELQDRELFAAIAEGREPNASVGRVMPCYRVLHGLEEQLNALGA